MVSDEFEQDYQHLMQSPGHESGYSFMGHTNRRQAAIVYAIGMDRGFTKFKKGTRLRVLQEANIYPWSEGNVSMTETYRDDAGRTLIYVYSLPVRR